MMIYSSTASFEKDLKKLLKRFRSLEEDLKVVKKNAIEVFHYFQIDNQSVFPLSQFCKDNIKIYKLKKFACKALKGKGVKSGLRLIYAHWPQNNTVDFIEIYFKGDKENEDRARIEKYLKEKE